MSYSKTTIVGHLGRTPEVKFLDDGKAVCNFSVAVNIGFGEDKTVQWYNVAVFGKTAEACGKWLDKGKQVLVTGTTRLREYKKKDGSRGTSLDMTADSFNGVVFLSPAGNGKGEVYEPGDNGTADTTKPHGDDDVPF